MKKMLFQIGAILAGCTLVALAFWSTAGSDADDDHDHDHHDEEFVHFSDDMVKAHNIDVRPAAPGTLKQRIRAPAQITIGSDQLSHVLPKVEGVVLTANKNIGESVKKGELLALIESKEIAEAKSNYLTALKRNQLADSVYQRESSLHDKMLASGEELHRAESAKDESIIDLELTRQKLHALGLSNENINRLPSEDPQSMRTYEVRSPISGKVIARDITPGEMLTTSSQIYVIADLSTVWAEANVFAHDREGLKIGQPVKIIGSKGQIAQSTVSFLSPIVDPETRTSTTLAAIDNKAGNWLPGTFVQAEFITDAIEVRLSVPKDAIQNIDGTDVVFVCQEGGFAVRPITTGKSDEECCEVVSGLEAGEKYACKNTFLLKADLKKEEAEHMD